MLVINGQTLETDAQGFLKDATRWNESVAEKLAEIETISLTPDHWLIVRFVRDYYTNYKSSPAVRILVKQLAQQAGADKGNSLYLHQLFKEPVKQASKIAGLPKPARCI